VNSETFREQGRCGVEFYFFRVRPCLGGAGEIFACRIVAKAAAPSSYLKSKDKLCRDRIQTGERPLRFCFDIIAGND